VARSFKYHRPRGIVTAGPEEPCALVDVIGANGREPNRLATTLPLHEGLVAESQNRWPSLRFDVLALNDLIARFLPAGFYYKTFMAPGWAAWRVSMCTRLAGLATVRCLPRTTVLGAYGHGVFGALETLSPAEAARFDGLRERLRIIRARRVVFATGALERLIAFPGN